MAHPEKRKLHKNILIAFAKVWRNGGVMHRQSSDTEDGRKGGGYIYFAGAKGIPISPKSGRFLIEEEIVKPLADGLFVGSSQSFRAVDWTEFEHFKERYAEVQLRLE